MKHNCVICGKQELDKDTTHFLVIPSGHKGGLGLTESTSAAVQTNCRASGYRPYRAAGRKVEYLEYAV